MEFYFEDSTGKKSEAFTLPKEHPLCDLAEMALTPEATEFREKIICCSYCGKNLSYHGRLWGNCENCGVNEGQTESLPKYNRDGSLIVLGTIEERSEKLSMMKKHIETEIQIYISGIESSGTENPNLRGIETSVPAFSDLDSFVLIWGEYRKLEYEAFINHCSQAVRKNLHEIGQIFIYCLNNHVEYLTPAYCKIILNILQIISFEF